MDQECGERCWQMLTRDFVSVVSVVDDELPVSNQIQPPPVSTASPLTDLWPDDDLLLSTTHTPAPVAFSPQPTAVAVAVAVPVSTPPLIDDLWGRNGTWTSVSQAPKLVHLPISDL